MHFDRVLVGVLVKVSRHTTEQHLPSSPERVGEELAQAIDAYVRANATGYYPALEYFRKVDGVDPDLIDTAEQMAWLISKLVREEIQKKLRPIFSSVQFQSIQTHAFSLPSIRPNQRDAVTLLARHYSPDTIKLELMLTLMRKDADTKDLKAEVYARKMIYRWLRDSFESVEVTASSAL